MLVIGNGESRCDINLSEINTTKIGCNAIVRDFFVDHLVCVDRRMVDEANNCYQNNFNFLYTRKDWFKERKDYKNINCVPELPFDRQVRADDPFNWGSGPYAVLVAVNVTKQNTIKLIGFDLYSQTTKVNNVYKDTNNYDSSEKSAVDPRYWVYQIGKIFAYFQKINFIVYNYNEWMLPKEWKYPNVSLDNLNNL